MAEWLMTKSHGTMVNKRCIDSMSIDYVEYNIAARWAAEMRSYAVNRDLPFHRLPGALFTMFVYPVHMNH